MKRIAAVCLLLLVAGCYHAPRAEDAKPALPEVTQAAADYVVIYPPALAKVFRDRAATTAEIKDWNALDKLLADDMEASRVELLKPFNAAMTGQVDKEKYDPVKAAEVLNQAADGFDGGAGKPKPEKE
jgi:hypothetical protein